MQTLRILETVAGLCFWRVCWQLLGTQAEVNLESYGPQRGKKQDFLSQVAIDTDGSPRIKRKKSLSVFSQRALTEKLGVIWNGKRLSAEMGNTGVAV